MGTERRGAGHRRVAVALAIGLSLAVLTGTAVAEPLDDALAAFQHGDNALALSLALPLAQQGNVGAEAVLGLAYESEGNIGEAAKWTRKAANQGNRLAQNLLGSMYAYGQGVPLDDAQAVVWFRKSAEQGYPDAEAELGRRYVGGMGVPQDYTIAREWLRKASDQGSANAQFGIAMLYADGKGVPQDNGVAVSWYRKAADQGYAAAQAMLGAMYYNGQGVPQDYGEAAKWSRKGADQGDANAQLCLGAMYDEGGGVPQDYVQAHKWYNLAAARFTASDVGMRDLAVKGRDQVAAKMTPAQIAEAQQLAREWKPDRDTAVPASGRAPKIAAATRYARMEADQQALASAELIDGAAILEIASTFHRTMRDQGMIGVADLISNCYATTSIAKTVANMKALARCVTLDLVGYGMDTSFRRVFKSKSGIDMPASAYFDDASWKNRMKRFVSELIDANPSLNSERLRGYSDSVNKQILILMEAEDAG